MKALKDIFWVNAVKAFCMIGVYIAHAEVYYPRTGVSLSPFINPFYVAAFFFVNGYLYAMKSSRERESTADRRHLFFRQLENVLVKLVIPTILFSTLIFVPRNIFHHEAMSVSKYAFMVLGGCANWFTAALACLQIYVAVFSLFCEKRSYLYCVFAVLSFAAALFLQRIVVSPFPWYWKSGLVGMLPFVLGLYYQKYENIFERKRAMMLIPVGLYLIYCIFFSKYDVLCNIPGVKFNPAGVLVMCLGILSVIWISKQLPENRVLSYIGRHSIVFYFLSGVLPALWGTILKRVFHAAPNYGVVILSIVFSLASAAACSSIIYRFLPFMVDIRKWPFVKAKAS